MKKNSSKKQKISSNEPSNERGISIIGRKIIFYGIFLVIIGYLVLTKADPYGQNLASNLSPFLIVGGYFLIGLGIVFPEKIYSDYIEYEKNRKDPLGR